jgi:ABC-type antimicrobial peptide transport system permease subunit
VAKSLSCSCPAATGTAIGAIGAFVLARLISSLLYGITPSDPPTFAGMIFVLITIAVVAGYLPARRASRIQPMTVLRSA